MTHTVWVMLIWSYTQLSNTQWVYTNKCALQIANHWNKMLCKNCIQCIIRDRTQIESTQLMQECTFFHFRNVCRSMTVESVQTLHVYGKSLMSYSLQCKLCIFEIFEFSISIEVSECAHMLNGENHASGTYLIRRLLIRRRWKKEQKCVFTTIELDISIHL